jgi:four helix bundle protein
MKNDQIKNNLIVNLTFEFSIMSMNFCEELDLRKKFVLSKQLFRSSTSIGANVWEAQNSESKPDFIHKFKIAAKEMDETKYWLLLCDNIYNGPDTKILHDKLNTIQKIITKIISSTKRKLIS